MGRKPKRPRKRPHQRAATQRDQDGAKKTVASPDFSSPRWQAEQEKIRKLHYSPRWQAELEHVRLIDEKLRKGETTAPRPQSETPERKRKPAGRHPSLTPKQIGEGISILRSQPRMTVEAARETLRDAGIKSSDSALYRLVIKPAYGSR